MPPARGREPPLLQLSGLRVRSRRITVPRGVRGRDVRRRGCARGIAVPQPRAHARGRIVRGYARAARAAGAFRGARRARARRRARRPPLGGTTAGRGCAHRERANGRGGGRIDLARRRGGASGSFSNVRHARRALDTRFPRARDRTRGLLRRQAPDRDSSFSPAPRPTHPAGFPSPELRRPGRRTAGGRAVQQGTSPLRPPLPAIAPNAAANDARASARRLVFGTREHVTSSLDRQKEHSSDAFFLDASRAALLRDANQGPMRTLSARTFETLLDESNVRENEVRPGARERAAIRPTARFLVRNERLEPGHPEARVSPRRRRTPPNPGATRGTFLLGTLFRRLFGIFLAQKKSASFALRHALRRGDASTLFLAPRSRIALERARADPRPTSAFSLHKKGVDGASEFAVASARRDGARRG